METEKSVVLNSHCYQSSRVFKLDKFFSFSVPIGYNHSTQLSYFTREPGEVRILSENLVNDSYFENVSNQLLPGEIYLAELYSISGRVMAEDFLDFLLSKQSLFVGAQGLSLLLQRETEKFSAITVACDQSKKPNGSKSGKRLPVGGKDEDGSVIFGVVFVEYAFDQAFQLLSVKKIGEHIQ